MSLALEAASLAEDLHRQKSEARFRSLVAHSSDLITVLDKDGSVTYQSPSIERLLGYSTAEIEGSLFGDLLTESDRSRLERILDHARRRTAPTRTPSNARSNTRTVAGSSSRCSRRTCSTTSTCAESS